MNSSDMNKPITRKQEDFKSVVVRKWIMENIENNVFKYGTKLPSENYLCNKFSISRQTVRNAIDVLEKDGIVWRKRGSGTYVAKMLNDVRNKTIGVLTSYLHEYIFPALLQGIEETLTAENYGIELGVTYNRIDAERNFLERMLKANVSGLLIEGTKSALPNPNIDLYLEFKRRETPIVFMHNYYQELTNVYPSILVNDKICTKCLTKHLIENGHKKIVGLFKIDDIQGQRRYAGYAEALLEAGIMVNEDIIGWFTSYKQEILFQPDITRILEAVDKYTAIVCYNDQLASMLFLYFNERGVKVPEDISMVGFDDSFSSPFNKFELTTIKHPKNELGARAAEVLIEMLKNGITAIPPSLIQMDAAVLLRNSVRRISSV